ncbi:MAG: RNA polymerase sigma factor [Verrucomicrobia bacterium]|nr:RNA polymerase sigma factor [Verrucomicrobiota bacterium]
MLAVADTEQLPVAAARTGDARAWDALFRRYQLPLYAYVAELVRHEQTALDIVQESFIAAARHIGSLADDARFGSWLFGIAHQKVIQHWRKRGRDVALFADADEMPEELPTAELDPLEWLVRREQEERFLQLLAKLPEPQRAVLLLHFLEDFSLDEIAVVTGAPLGTVKSRLHYAKKSLRQLLEEQP